MCFFFPFYSAFSLCGENCSFFVCVPAINALVDDPRCQIQENGKCQQFYPQTNQHVSRYILYLCIVFRLDRENLYRLFWVFGVFFCFFCLVSCNDFCSPNPKKMCFFVRVCLLKKIYFTTALPLSVSVTRFLSLIFSCATGPFCLCIPAFNTELQIDVSSSEIRLFLTWRKKKNAHILTHKQTAGTHAHPADIL